MAKRGKYQDKGQCPKCGSRNVDYAGSNICDDGIGYEFTCKDCGVVAVEWYDLVYSETLIDD